MTTLESTIYSGTINLDAVPVTRAGFGTVLILGNSATFAERIRFYSSSAELLAASVGISATSPEYKQAIALEANGLKRFAVGKVVTAGGSADANWGVGLDAVVAESNDFYGVCMTSVTQADIESVASKLAGHQKLGCFGSSDASGIGGGGTSDLASVVKTASYDRAAVWLHTVAADALILPAALLGAFLSASPDTTAPIAAHRTLQGVAIDTGLTTTQLTNALGKRANVYSSSKGLGTTWPGLVGSGRYLDQILLRDWYEARLVEDLQQLVSAEANADRRIPMTAAGYTMIENVGRARDEAGIAAGWFEEFDDDGERAFRAVVPAAGTDKANRRVAFEFRHRQTGAAQSFIYTANLDNV